MKLSSIIKTSVFLLITLGFLCAESAEQQTLKLGDHLLQVDLAKTPAQRRQGLMFREHLAEDKGMLFVYPNSQRRKYCQSAIGALCALEVRKGWFEDHGIAVGEVFEFQ